MVDLPDSPSLHSWDEETLIKSYFKEGYTYSEICSFLKLRHGIVLTIDQLRGRLKKFNLKRQGDEIQTPLEVVSLAIMVISYSLALPDSPRYLSVSNTEYLQCLTGKDDNNNKC